MDLGLEVTERDGWAVLAVRGEVDVYTAPRFRERLIELVSEGKHRIIVDLEAVDFLDSTGIGDDRVDDLKLAVSEACTNAIEAHDAIDTDERVIVRCRDDETGLEVEIEDRGAGFDPSLLPDHPPVTDPDRLKFERGLGVPLIKTLVDEVEFSSSSAGTAV